ncbi:MAG: hypothetical protein PWP65_1342 [Clostridia bacterium]|nr:hypothetical protein [Clostridia bacterium]
MGNIAKAKIVRVEVRLWQVNGRTGYDLLVRDPEASVADYLQALESLPGDKIYRPYNPGGSCLGCDCCCGGRLPLTSIDLFTLRAGIQFLTGRKLTPEEVLDKYCQVAQQGRALDITLRLDAEGYCIFLDPGTRRCRLYAYRPLVCRSFYCCPVTRRAARLRERIVNAGEDELVRLWLKLKPREAHRRKLRPSDWPPTPFAGRSAYAEVPLRPFFTGCR